MTAAPDTSRVTYEVLDAEGYAAAAADLGVILADAVDSGTPMTFIQPFSAGDGEAWFRSRIGDVADGRIRPIVAIVDGRIEGHALVIASPSANAAHRAEVGKVAVHRRSRRLGLARGMMAAIESVAWADGRWLLMLDTVTGSAADRLYRSLGWQELGTIADHSRMASGRLVAATYFYKDLRRSADFGRSGLGGGR